MSHLVGALPAMAPFVGPDQIERRMGCRFDLRLGANESAFGISPAARQAMEAALAAAHWYDDPTHYELRRAIADRLAVDPETVMVAGGIDELLGLAVRALINPGDAAVASDGAYPTFRYHLAGFGGRLETVLYNDFRNSVDGLAQAARRRSAKIVYLSNPDNPTGSLLSRNEIARLIEQLPLDCMCFLDEAYEDFVEPEDVPEIGAFIDRLVRFRTFSKAHGMAGMRIGYLHGPAQLVAGINRFRLHFGVNRAAQAGALASLGDDGFIRRVAAEVRRGREDYYQLGREIDRRTLESWTNFVLFRFNNEQEAASVAQQLERRRVFVRSANGEGIRTGVRVTVGTEQERRLFREALLAAV